MPPGAPVVVGVSGGRDSVCLLAAAVALAGADAVLAVHVHHGLRGRDADADAVHAARLARRLGAAIRTERLCRPHASSGSPAVWAREARRSVLRAAADAWGGPATPVAVAHTATDQAETVLLRAISSPGARARAGMAAVDGGVVRPLLAAGVRREEAAAWCAARALPWREDPGNATSPRGRVRALLTGLEAVDGRAVAALVAGADRAREDDDALRASAIALLPPGRAPRAPRRALAAAPPAVARRALRLLAERAVDRPCPRVGARLEEVLALDPGPRGTAALDLGDGVRATVAGEELSCAPSPPRAARAADPPPPADGPDGPGGAGA
nr:ATP-binding protein [Patulibacter sp. SYSU D01012]